MMNWAKRRFSMIFPVTCPLGIELPVTPEILVRGVEDRPLKEPRVHDQNVSFGTE
jgi:hypothetical protein